MCFSEQVNRMKMENFEDFRCTLYAFKYQRPIWKVCITSLKNDNDILLFISIGCLRPSDFNQSVCLNNVSTGQDTTTGKHCTKNSPIIASLYNISLQ